MHKNASIFILLIALVFGFNIPNEEEGFKPLEDIEQFKQNVKEMALNTTSIESDFSQEKHLTMLEEVLISEGYFCYKKENKVRWEYKTPIQYLIIINDARFIIFDGNKTSEFDVNSNKIFKEINNMIINSIQGSILENEDFTISYYENDDHYLAKLNPNEKNVKKILRSINIYFDKKDFSVSMMKMIEISGDYTDIKFINKKLNEALPDTLFSLN